MKSKDSKENTHSKLFDSKITNDKELYMEIEKLQKQIEKLNLVHNLINQSIRLRHIVQTSKNEMLRNLAKKRIDSINMDLRIIK